MCSIKKKNETNNTAEKWSPNEVVHKVCAVMLPLDTLQKLLISVGEKSQGPTLPRRSCVVCPTLPLLLGPDLPHCPAPPLVFQTHLASLPTPPQRGFPSSSVGEDSARSAGDPGSILGSGRSPREGISYPLQYAWVSLVARLVKNLPLMWETWVWSLGWKDTLEKGKATHSSILAWRIPWTE